MDLVYSALCPSSNVAARGCKETRVLYQGKKTPNTVMHSSGEKEVCHILQAENSASPGGSPGSTNSSTFGTSPHHGYQSSVGSQIPHLDTASAAPLKDDCSASSLWLILTHDELPSWGGKKFYFFRPER